MTISPESLDLAALSYVSITNLSGLPHASGVYFVLDSAVVPVYIGQTVSLRTRLTSHVNKKAFLALEGGRCAWLLVPYASLTTIEIAIIDFFKPVMNKMKGGNTKPVTEAADYERLLLRLPSYVLQDLRAQAEEEQRPLNTHVLRCLQQFLYPYTEKKPGRLGARHA